MVRSFLDIVVVMLGAFVIHNIHVAIIIKG